ncbi:ABC transporter permease [Chitinibacteraceae bacterium HSL-7]
MSARFSRSGDRTLILEGRLDAAGCAPLWNSLVNEAKSDDTLDASAVSYCDGTGAALLFTLHQRGVTIQGLATPFASLLAHMEPETPLKRPESKPDAPVWQSWLAHMRQQSVDWLAFTGELVSSSWQTLRRPESWRVSETLRLATLTGADALPIIALIAFLLGVILAFQSAIPMRQFGAELFVADLVGLALVRELAPLLTAILLAGRTGAAFAAEIGTMKVNQEIDALVTMGLDPMRYLVIPRIVAVAFVTPLLTLFAELIGIAGMALVLLNFEIPLNTAWREVQSIVDMSDYLTGLGKAAVFGFGIAAIGCLRGLQTGQGASAVGQAATRADVSAIVMLVVLDGLFAVAFYYLGW